MPNKVKIKNKESINDYLKQYDIVFILSYTGTTVNNFQNFRDILRAFDTKVSITKNKIFALTAKELNCEGDLFPIMCGQNVVVYGKENNIVDLAKAIVNFSKECKTLQVKGMISTKKLQGADVVVEYSKLASLDELRGQILSVISSASGGALCRVINEVSTSLLRVISQKHK